MNTIAPSAGSFRHPRSTWPRAIESVARSGMPNGLTCLCLAVVAAVLTVSAQQTLAGASAPDAETSVSVSADGQQVELRSPSFVYTLDISSGLRGVSWENRKTGRLVDLGRGSEVELDLDAAERRIWIRGWRCGTLQADPCDPNEEPGLLAGVAKPEYDDSNWDPTFTTLPHSHHMGRAGVAPKLETSYYWIRTHVFLPYSAAGKQLSLTLGGFGLYDYRYMRVFVNGHEAGVRHAPQRWNSPGTLDLGRTSPVYEHLRFGQDNVIAVQATGFHARPARLDEVDPQGVRTLPMKCDWPGQCEQFLTVGQPLRTPKLSVNQWRQSRAPEHQGTSRRVDFELSALKSGVTVGVTYEWNEHDPVLKKRVEIKNSSARPIRLMNLRLGTYKTDVAVTPGEQGFPVYLADDRFVSLAHPSGWAVGEEGRVEMRQYPGKDLAPGRTFRSMEAVYGVTACEATREGFRAHVRSRCRRVTHGHDRPYAIFDCFGSGKVDEDFFQTEEDTIENIQRFAEGQRDAGYRFDFYSIQFWADYRGDLEHPDPKRFPGGFETIKQRLAELNTPLGLWIDSSWEIWTIGGNPVVQPTLTHNAEYGPDFAALCRATDPIRSMYTEAFRHHIRENGVRLCKFDNLLALCHNPNHDHLPGVYSTEAIHNGVLETLRALDKENPDVFIMLYWGHRSPWWLLDADTLFESGLGVEAANPGGTPTLHARDSVTVGLDQAHWWCEDVPRLGNDSLGVLLTEWQINSSIGKEGWQDALVLDICRGSMLAQVWSDHQWLSPPERRQIGEFIELLRARPECFGNSKSVLGNPWKNEPYGYCCSSGERAFIVLNNCTWSDVSLPLDLGPAWGLAAGRDWDLYRWHPDPAKLVGEKPAFGESVTMRLRPFEVVLLEVVPAGGSPSLDRSFDECALPAFVEASRDIQVSATEQTIEADGGKMRRWTIRGELPAVASAATLAVSVEMSRGSKTWSIWNVGENFSAECQLSGGPISAQPVFGDKTLKVSWQAWRIPVAAAAKPRPFEITVDSKVVTEGVEMRFAAHLLPKD